MVPPTLPYSSPVPPVSLEFLDYLAKRFGKTREHMWEVVYYASLNEDSIFPTKIDILAVIAVESGFDARALHPKGPSVGLMQVNAGVHGGKGLYQPSTNVRRGSAILKKYWTYSHSRSTTFVVYNSGPGGAILACPDMSKCSTEYSGKVQQVRREFAAHLKG